ncbi:MAG: prephenate dehydratase [Lachnospiraceae bacterium]
MTDLIEIRKNIDDIDRKIVELYENRMRLTEEVAAYKIETGKPVLDKSREDEKLNRVKDMAGTDFSKQSIQELFEQIMAVSRKRQYQMIAEHGTKNLLGFESVDHIKTSGSRIVYQGTEGAYSQQASQQFFGKKENISSVETWRDAMEAIKCNAADYAVLPIENSSAGIVSENYDLLMEYDNVIIGEQIIKIDHCLLGHNEAELQDIKDVYSHAQALMQCSRYLGEHREWSTHSTVNTAVSAKKVNEIGKRENAAIASRLTAQLYGLKILADDIQNNPMNSTRFIIVTGNKIFHRSAKKISICFEILHKSGSLYHALSHFIFNNLSLNKIESRPIQGKNWEYRFFVDIEGNLMDGSVLNALVGLKQETESLKILGNY